MIHIYEIKKNLGEQIKKIRKNKKMTQKELGGSLLSQPTLTKIEKKGIITSYSNYLFIADQLNVSIDELNYLANNKHVSPFQEILLERRNQRLRRFNPVKMDKYIAKCVDYYERTNNRAFWLLEQSAISWKVFHANFEVATLVEYSNKIKIELGNMDKWYLFEIEMMASALYGFNADEVQEIGEYLLDCLKEYKSFIMTEALKLEIILGVMAVLSWNKRSADVIKWGEKIILGTWNSESRKYLHIINFRLALAYLDTNDQKNFHKKMQCAMVLVTIYNINYILEPWKIEVKKNYAEYDDKLKEYGLV
ncbi:hypothetical protein AwErysi_05120 [Erysipelotrichaceae bacterium]|nr:hypothetical protein AwErysi_05120 [Erysipelotrichaceae bacterium]